MTADVRSLGCSLGAQRVELFAGTGVPGRELLKPLRRQLVGPAREQIVVRLRGVDDEGLNRQVGTVGVENDVEPSVCRRHIRVTRRTGSAPARARSIPSLNRCGMYR
jgi:hypothetical protein